jgi:acetyl esterase/lipase
VTDGHGPGPDGARAAQDARRRPVEVGIGAGPLSEAALARLTRGTEERLELPDLSDRGAVAAWRSGIHEAWGEGTEPDEVPHRRLFVAGVECLEAGPPGAPMLLYLHGGGYALGSPGVAAPITARLARRLHVVSVAYRLAPEHPFPAALDDALAVYAALLGREVSRTRRVAVAGDSAGGGLSLALALRVRAEARRPPLALVLLCPHLDHADPSVDRSGGVAALAAAYRGAVPADDPRVSPLRGDLGGLPPTLVQAGTRDALLPQAVRFARRAHVAGSPVTLDIWDGLWHTWQYHRDLPEADRALTEAAAFVEVAALGSPAVPP